MPLRACQTIFENVQTAGGPSEDTELDFEEFVEALAVCAVYDRPDPTEPLHVKMVTFLTTKLKFDRESRPLR